jgi:hypothetical protein
MLAYVSACAPTSCSSLSFSQGRSDRSYTASPDRVLVKVGQSRGSDSNFALITFDNPESARRAVSQANQTLLRSNRITVAHSKQGADASREARLSSRGGTLAPLAKRRRIEPSSSSHDHGPPPYKREGEELGRSAIAGNQGRPTPMPSSIQPNPSQQVSPVHTEIERSDESTLVVSKLDAGKTSIDHSSSAPRATVRYSEPSSSRGAVRIADTSMDYRRQNENTRELPKPSPDTEEDVILALSEGPEEATVCEFVYKFGKGGGSRKHAIARFIKPLQADGWVVLDFHMPSAHKVHVYTVSRDSTSARFRPEEDGFLRAARKLPSFCVGRGEKVHLSREQFRVDSIREETNSGNIIVESLQVHHFDLGNSNEADLFTSCRLLKHYLILRFMSPSSDPMPTLSTRPHSPSRLRDQKPDRAQLELFNDILSRSPSPVIARDQPPVQSMISVFPIGMNPFYVDPKVRIDAPDFIAKCVGPCSRKTSLADSIIVRFLKNMDENRQMLLDVYERDATISISFLSSVRAGLPPPNDEGWPELAAIFRNIKQSSSRKPFAWIGRFPGTHVRLEPPVTKGRYAIVNLIRQLPPLQHRVDDPCRFSFDASVLPDSSGDQARLILSLHGEFTEFESRITRSFDRSFVLRPSVPGSMCVFSISSLFCSANTKGLTDQLWLDGNG